jgi:hypothetical protein
MAYAEGGQSKRCRETLPAIHCVRWLWRNSPRPGTPGEPGGENQTAWDAYLILSRRDASRDPVHMMAILPNGVTILPPKVPF